MGLREVGKNFKISRRPLEFIYLIDTSGSMSGAKIQSVNNAMHELEHALKEEARKNPTAEVLVRIITFGGDNARWHLQTKTPAEQFVYNDINDVYGLTPMGGAFNILSMVLDSTHMQSRSLRPVVVLLSDGEPNDNNWEANLDRFLKLPWGAKAVKIAIAVKGANRTVLEKFTQDPSLVLNANNATDLKNFIRWTSTLVSHVSQPATAVDEQGRVREVKIKAPDTQLTDDSDF